MKNLGISGILLILLSSGPSFGLTDEEKFVGLGVLCVSTLGTAAALTEVEFSKELFIRDAKWWRTAIAPYADAAETDSKIEAEMQVYRGRWNNEEITWEELLDYAQRCSEMRIELEDTEERGSAVEPSETDNQSEVAANGSETPERAKSEFKVIEKWQCYSTTDYSKTKVLLEVTRQIRIDNGFEFGVLTVAGKTRLTGFSVDGFDRRWDFDNNQFAFSIDPEGDGLYYDFSGESKTAKPSQFYKCVMQTGQ